MLDVIRYSLLEILPQAVSLIFICLSPLSHPSLAVSKLILVQQPFMERRVMATFHRQWPGQNEHTHIMVTSPRVDMAAYPNASVGSKHDLICYMLGTYLHLLLYLFQ